MCLQGVGMAVAHYQRFNNYFARFENLLFSRLILWNQSTVPSGLLRQFQCPPLYYTDRDCEGLA